MEAPLIGIATCESFLSVSGAQARPITFLNRAYVDLISSFGAIPLLLSSHTKSEHIERLVSLLDGLLLIGGQDIDPSTYDEPPHIQYRSEISGIGERFLRPVIQQPSLKRDLFEISLYHQAKRKTIPILGICRGLQLINVAEGGTLFQELPEDLSIHHAQAEDGWIHYHTIVIDPSSKIHSLLQTERYMMSSLHHQGIKKLGTGLHKAAWSEDGVIEMIECINDRDFVIGVHGHIEQTRQNLKLYDKILQEFILRAGASHELQNQRHHQRNPFIP